VVGAWQPLLGAGQAVGPVGEEMGTREVVGTGTGLGGIRRRCWLGRVVEDELHCLKNVGSII